MIDIFYLYCSKIYRAMASKKITIEEINNRIPTNSFFTAIQYVEPIISPSGQRKSRIECRCICGNLKICTLSDLLRGNPFSCGCKKGNKGRKTEYGILRRRWSDMRNRCYNEKVPGYKDYGGRGVRVCDEWLNDFEAFRTWSIENGFKPELQLDKDELGDGLLYSPATCQWVSFLHNMNFRQKSVKYTFRGEQMSIPQIARLTGILESLLRDRLKQGFPIDEAVKLKKYHNFKKY